MTPADVVYSLDQNINLKLGGLYRPVFDRVASITATSQNQVTITLKQPDHWLEGELSSMPGIVIEKSLAQKEGANYGTPGGGIMCTGAYLLKWWTPGVGVVAVRNPHYWNPAVHSLVGQITIKPPGVGGHRQPSGHRPRQWRWLSMTCISCTTRNTGPRSRCWLIMCRAAPGSPRCASAPWRDD